MDLTGKQIIEKGIAIGAGENCIQQQGIDCEVVKISRLITDIPMNYGIIPKEGKTVRPKYEEVKLNSAFDCDLESGIISTKANKQCWILPIGWYDIELAQGVDMKDRYKGYFKTRSSLVRCGAIIHSGQFDAGFKTDHAGCFLEVKNPIEIEYGARIAQFIVSETSVVENTYDGQWQNDKQRKK